MAETTIKAGFRGEVFGFSSSAKAAIDFAKGLLERSRVVALTIVPRAPPLFQLSWRAA